jgi:uncharacterized membrane-anchored protein YitT (DUF2179 family)
VISRKVLSVLLVLVVVLSAAVVVIKSIYTGGINGTEVILYTIVNGIHAWLTTPITAADIIWNFFVSHPNQ